MKYRPYFYKQFKKDFKNCIKEGKDMERIKMLMAALLDGEDLPARHRLHRLSGSYKDYYECHITSDWLLIFSIDGESLIFVRTGSHSKLFD